MEMSEEARKVYDQLKSRISGGTALSDLVDDFGHLRELHGEWTALSTTIVIKNILPTVGGMPRAPSRRGKNKVPPIANIEKWKRLLLDPEYFPQAFVGKRKMKGGGIEERYWPIKEFIPCCATRALKVYDWCARPNVSQRVVDSSNWIMG